MVWDNILVASLSNASICMQGQAVCALLQNIEGVTVVGIASKNKHEDIKASVTHLIDRASDVHAEVRK